MTNSTKIKIQFDNGGGVTVEIESEEYSHYFSDGKHAAAFMNAIKDEPNLSLDGNEWDDDVRAVEHESNAGYAEGTVRSSYDRLDAERGHNVADFLAVVR